MHSDDTRAVSARWEAWLFRVWWLLMPAFALLVTSLIHERACLNLDDPLPAISTRPLLAWPVAAFYLGVHVWFVLVYLLLVHRTGRAVPGWRDAWRLARNRHIKAGAASVLLLLEYTPVGVWRGLATLAGLCSG